MILQQHPRKIERRRIIGHLALDACLWTLAIAANSWNSAGLGASAIAGAVLAILTFRAFAMMHDCVHGAFSTKTIENRWVGEAFGILCFLPFSSWRELHLAHHRWTGNFESDPSMKLIFDFKRRGERVSPIVRWAWRGWIPLLGFLQHLVFWRATISKRELLFVFGAVMYSGVLLLIFQPATLLAGALTYLWAVEIINFPHHLGLRQYGEDSHFNVVDQDRFVRSSIYPRWFARLVLLNFNLHTEHHAFPAHPWYQLESIHQQLVLSGETFNFESGNQWILKNRRRPIEEIFRISTEGRAPPRQKAS